MAWTTEDKAQLIRYFGYPARSNWIGMLGTQCTNMDSESPESTIIYQKRLKELRQCEDQMEQARQKFSDLNYNMREYEMLRQRAAAIIEEIAQGLEVAVARNLYNPGKGRNIRG
jgi:hypothetical protein